MICKQLELSLLLIDKISWKSNSDTDLMIFYDYEEKEYLSSKTIWTKKIPRKFEFVLNR